MRWFIFGLLLTANLAATPCTARDLAEIQSSGSIAIVTTSASPPHGFKDPSDGTFKGIMVEVAQAVAKRLHVAARITDVAFAGLIPTLTAGRADLLASPMLITEERAKVVDFSAPVYAWGEGIVCAEKNDKHVSHLADLRGSRIGTIADSVQFNMAQEIPDATVSTYADYPTLLADVRAGRIDYGIVDPPSIAYQMKAKSISGVRLETEYKPTKIWRVGLVVQKGNSTLLDAVNAALSDLVAHGEIDAILVKWGLPQGTAK